MEVEAYQRKLLYLQQGREYRSFICSRAWEHTIENRVAKTFDEAGGNGRIGIVRLQGGMNVRFLVRKIES